MRFPAANLIDFYKADHRSQYPKKTNRIFTNLTPRGSRVPGINHVVFFSMQSFVIDVLINEWNETFFNVPKDIAIKKYKRRIENALGPNAITFEHMEALHDLGYLPLKIMALPEGSIVPLRVPLLIVFNTIDEFFWLVNYIETIMSSEMWQPITSATTAFEYRKLLNKYALKTVGNTDFVQWQGHDFSFRGMPGRFAAAASGAGHLLSFTGTDTDPAIDFLEEYYGADSDKELIGGSVYATEHSVMCMGTKESELETYRRILTEVYPKGIVSIVSDTWDYWNVVTNTIPALKDVIMAREGKFVTRPDSSKKTPVEVICGDPEAKTEAEFKGTVQLLYETFGGPTNKQGYKELDPHVGMIYGDSITLQYAREIVERLEAKGFVSISSVLGIGSFTYQYVTRDTFGLAVKSTYGEIDHIPQEIFKQPKTDSGLKNSAKGLTAVYEKDGTFVVKEQATWEEVENCAFETVFLDGKLTKRVTLQQIRDKVLTKA